MRTFCISCVELPQRMEDAKKHFRAHDVPAEFINGIHGETFGILSYKPYRRDHPNAGSLNDIAQVGLCLSHYLVWTVCAFLPDEMFLICEDDSKWPHDWSDRIDKALSDAGEFDILLIGNANCEDKPKEHVKGDVWIVKYPFCTHAMIIHRKALPTLLMECRDAHTKIDITLMAKAYPKLRVLTVWPRIIGQRGTELVS